MQVKYSSDCVRVCTYETRGNKITFSLLQTLAVVGLFIFVHNDENMNLTEEYRRKYVYD